MKKKILKDAEGNEVEVEEYESFSMKDLTADPEEIIRMDPLTDKIPYDWGPSGGVK